MKKRWSFLFVLVIFSATHAVAQVTVFIVRHAEKEQRSSRDPDLSDAGRTRAKVLDSILGKVAIDEVYATPYKRTRNTVAPVADRLGLKILSYDPSAQDKFAATLKAASEKTILIAGHSNTVPDLINMLTGNQDYEDLPESEYDNLYVITISKENTRVICLQYGAPTD